MNIHFPFCVCVSRSLTFAASGVYNLLTILTFFIHNSLLCNLHNKIPKYPFKFVQFAYCFSPFRCAIILMSVGESPTRQKERKKQMVLEKLKEYLDRLLMEYKLYGLTANKQIAYGAAMFVSDMYPEHAEAVKELWEGEDNPEAYREKFGW